MARSFLCMQDSKEKEAKGFLLFLTNLNNLHMLSFLADTLLVFSRYQQKLQSDFITILDLTKENKFCGSKTKIIMLRKFTWSNGK